jgi:hypothetical protein
MIEVRKAAQPRASFQLAEQRKELDQLKAQLESGKR